MEMKIELVYVSVSDIERAKNFYVQAGFNADFDRVVRDGLRFVQLTPPGSACSICLGEGFSDMAVGTMDFIQMVVKDAEATHAELEKRGIKVSPVTPLEWGKFVYFTDPDGNKWALQELPKRA